MSMIKCPVCKTAKKFAGLGGIYKECSKCKGIGYIDNHSEMISLESAAELINKRKEKKHGKGEKTSD